MSKAKFVPAIGEQFVSVWQRGLTYKGKDGKEYDMKFFTDKSHFNYDIALQCCYYPVKNGTQEKVGKRYRDMVGYPEDKILITDSAGFQFASFAKKGETCDITALESLKWQEENGDIIMNLDIPPNLDGNLVYEDFIKALNISVKNFQFFQDNRKNYNTKLLNVLHGETYDLMNIWYEKVKHFKFDGWGLGIKPPFDPMLQAVGFMFLWEKGEFDKESTKWLHFFGTSGKNVVPTIVYAAHILEKVKKVKIDVSFDSSSYNIGSIYRTYYLPFDKGPHLSFGDKFKKLNPNLKELPCTCPVCRSIKDINELNRSDIYAGTLISLHNMYQYIQYNDLLNSLVEQKNVFIDYLNKFGTSEKTLKSIEFIDFAIKNGLKNATQKYSKWLVPQDLNKCKQGGIFDF